MNADLWIRPTAPAELPSLAHVTNREDPNKREQPQQGRKKDKRPPPQPQADDETRAPRNATDDDSTSTIDLLA